MGLLERFSRFWKRLLKSWGDLSIINKILAIFGIIAAIAAIIGIFPMLLSVIPKIDENLLIISILLNISLLILLKLKSCKFFLSGCKIGIKDIKVTKETLEETIKMANDSYRWWGLSAKNILDNTSLIEEKSREFKFEFCILDKNLFNTKSQLSFEWRDLNNPPKLFRAQKITRGDEILKDLESKSMVKEVVRHYRGPDFRIVLIEEPDTQPTNTEKECRAFVTFYSKVDAMKAKQLEILKTNHDENIYFWFNGYYNQNKLDYYIEKFMKDVVSSIFDAKDIRPDKKLVDDVCDKLKNRKRKYADVEINAKNISKVLVYYTTKEN